jgi:transposase
MCLDKAYDFPVIREQISDLGYTPHVRSRGEEKRALEARSGFRARRWVVGRSHSWINRYRRLLVRWEKKAANDLRFLHFVCGIFAYRAAGVAG